MSEILHHPALGAFLFCLLALWPLGKIYARLGISPFWAAGIFLSLLLPFLGLAFVAGVAAHAPWPKMPPRRKPARKILLHFRKAAEDA